MLNTTNFNCKTDIHGKKKNVVRQTQNDTYAYSKAQSAHAHEIPRRKNILAQTLAFMPTIRMLTQH